MGFILEFDPKPGAPVPLEQLSQLLREQMEMGLMGLKQFVETGQRLPVPSPGAAVLYSPASGP